MFKIIFVIIGSLIGAGFASGKEIYIFFMQYGKNGILGIFLTGLITSLIIYRVLMITKTFEIKNYNKFLERVNWKHERINKLINLVVNFFLLSSFYIMVAGFSVYINQTYNIPIHFSSILFVVICYIVFIKNVNGVIKTNELLVPIIILFILFIGFRNIEYGSKINISFNDYKSINQNLFSNWIVSSILYASYNSIIIIPILTTIGKLIKSKKQIMKVSIISGVIIVILAICIITILTNNSNNIKYMEMPLIEVVENYGIIKYIYGFVIISSIFTSAVSTGYSFIKNVSNKNDNKLLVAMCVSAVIISNIGFSKLVETLYPLFGIFGLIQIFQIS